MISNARVELIKPIKICAVGRSNAKGAQVSDKSIAYSPRNKLTRMYLG